MRWEGVGFEPFWIFACENPLEEVYFPEKVDYWIPKLREDIASLFRGQCIVRKQ